MNGEISKWDIIAANAGQRPIGFICGCFDPFHYGHANMLEQAALIGWDHPREPNEALVVRVLGDDGIRLLKGREPFQDERTRARMVSMHYRVAHVYVSDVIDASHEIRALKPRSFYNSEEYPRPWIEEEACKEVGCRMVAIPRTVGISAGEVRDMMRKHVVVDEIDHWPPDWPRLAEAASIPILEKPRRPGD